MDAIFFGLTTFRNELRKFGIKRDDRRRHFYAVGKTGMGKTEMLKNIAVQDIQRGNGMGFIDPHGETAEDLLNFIPEHRIEDLVYFNPADTKQPIAFNVMENVDPELRHMVASGLMSVFKKIWPDVWSARMEYILNYAVLALLEVPDSTVLGINRMLSDAAYRVTVVDQVQDPVVKAFWNKEYARYTQRYEVEATAAIQNKIGQFISNPLIRSIIGQPKSSINMRHVMDNQQILIANLSKGKIGEDNARLLGGLLVTKLQLAAMSRVDIPEEDRSDFYLTIDEFQNFATDSFISILSEARKYRLCLSLSHQYISQLEGETDHLRDAVFGNVGTIVSFRVGAEDAEFLEKEFTPYFLMNDFVNIAKYNIFVKLMIDGVSSKPFSAQTPPPPEPLCPSFKERAIARSQEKYGTPLQEVSKQIANLLGDISEATLMPSQEGAEGPILYDAICSMCKKPTKVVFPPDGKRPVYCKTCRKKLKQPSLPVSLATREILPSASPAVLETKENKPSPVSLGEVLKKDPVLFHPGSKKNNDMIRPRAELDRGGLKQALLDALVNRQDESSQDQKKELRPGETVTFKEE
ncbi:MAG: type IV secretion system DNA-binding domain-containing protein [bacterium]|nr:type IV secretion system DNA-binding domain-containing protein [bacterium]